MGNLIQRNNTTNLWPVCAAVKGDMVKHKLRDERLKARVESLKVRVEIQKCEFESTSYELESASSRIIKNSMKTEVKRVRKSFLFPRIISPRLFGNS